MSSLDSFISNITSYITSVAADLSISVNLTNITTSPNSDIAINIKQPTPSSCPSNSCSYFPWGPFIVFCQIALFICIFCFAAGSSLSRDDLLTDLDNTPAHELHAKVSELCDMHLDGRDRKEKPELHVYVKNDFGKGERKITILERLGGGEREQSKVVEEEWCLGMEWRPGMATRRFPGLGISEEKARSLKGDEEVGRLLAGFSDRII
ncbi:hypothetical protein ONS95_010643 [Cadophora gregata]|uniref:uncharacterized protein n=1 Tax=Cadophora gregata TaxID=51156 RepID=UPI0026DD9C8D|nr:uncharacterized protein ONS95_010643 [Cadophora gregata]KAK0122404.1 hypothetical protein ONS95_010643 [Cadophora gregata]KAK0127883.1 hypothetical protein ONS96_007383 [Cadophora gregata f. sp. sojae]